MERALVTHQPAVAKRRWETRNNRKVDLLICLFVKKEYVVRIPCYYFSYIVATLI